MSTTKHQWQIFASDTQQLRIPGRLGNLQQFGTLQCFWQGLKLVKMFFEQLAIDLFQVLHKVGGINLIVGPRYSGRASH